MCRDGVASAVVIFAGSAEFNDHGKPRMGRPIGPVGWLRTWAIRISVWDSSGQLLNSAEALRKIKG